MKIIWMRKIRRNQGQTMVQIPLPLAKTWENVDQVEVAVNSETDTVTLVPKK